MDLQKLELLIKKINLTVKTIEKFKENEQKYLEEIKKISNENKRLVEENSSLKNEINLLKEDVNKNTILHKELEDKIIEIIKYLPDEEVFDNIENSKSETENIQNHVDNLAYQENEETMLKSFVKGELSSENSLFTKEDDKVVAEDSHNEPDVEENQSDVVSVKEEKEKNGEYELKFGSMLFDEEEEKEVNFNFEDSSNTSNDEELPKGVL